MTKPEECSHPWHRGSKQRCPEHAGGAPDPRTLRERVADLGIGAGACWCTRTDPEGNQEQARECPQHGSEDCRYVHRFYRAELAAVLATPESAESGEAASKSEAILRFIQRADDTRARLSGNAFTDLYVLAMAEFGLSPEHPDLWPNEPDYCREMRALAAAHTVRWSTND